MLALTLSGCAGSADRDEPVVESRLTTEHFEKFEELEARDERTDVDGRRDSDDRWRALSDGLAAVREGPASGDTGEVAAAGAYSGAGADGLHDIRGDVRAGQAGGDGRVARIQALFGAGSPLNPYAALFVERADEYGIDWRLAPAIAVWESSSGRHACGGNAYGIGSCGAAYRYESWEAGVEAVISLLGSSMYQGLSTAGKLCMWVSGRSACGSEHSRAYAGRVMQSMEGMGPR